MGRLRETKRGAITGAAGALVVTRRPRSAARWGAAGGALGGLVDVVHGHQQQHSDSRLEVVKRDVLYRRERKRSPLKAVEVGAGATLAVAGGSRVKMIGRGIGWGTRLPGNRSVLFHRLEQTRNAAQRGTKWVAPTMRRQPEVAGAIDLVPHALRPATATVIGVSMVNHGRPVSRDRYVPVTQD